MKKYERREFIKASVMGGIGMAALPGLSLKEKISPQTTYIAAYWSSLGDYAADNGHFLFPRVNDPLTGLGDGTDGPNGIYQYTATPALPTTDGGGHAKEPR